ncbi:MAG: patatin-like phospholipase family protein [Candidatus Liptonbacteria bacterium]|nr:patatin-like phospholipase family protein [Candidatus Liptonbacteria bacterium]
MEKLLKKLKEDGHTIVLSGSIGAIPAIASSIIIWKLLEPYKNYFDAIRAASGSSIPLAFAATGMPPDEIRSKMSLITLKDVVEDIGLFAEHNEGKGLRGKLKDLIAYYTDAFNAAGILMRHLTDGVGIIKGDNMAKLIASNLPVNNFGNTYPKLEVVATDFNTLRPYIFSASTTPEVLISEAATASCAMRGIFMPRSIQGAEYIDAAQCEPLPLLSVLNSHLAKGLDPKKLFILGFFVHTFSRKAPEKRHYLALDRHYGRAAHKDLFQLHKQILHHHGVKFIILELDTEKVVLPPPEEFPDLSDLGINWRGIRKLFARFANKSQVERLLRGVSIFLYEEINLRHLPCFIEALEPEINRKLLEKVQQFKFT